MECQELQQSELAEKYVSGQLDPATQDQFEMHILDCPACQQRVELLQTVREDLTAHAHEIRAYSIAPLGRLQWWSWAAVAAMFVIVGGLGLKEWRDLRRVRQEAAVAQSGPSANQSSATSSTQIAANSVPTNGRNYANFDLKDSQVTPDNAPAIGSVPRSGLNTGKRISSNGIEPGDGKKTGPTKEKGPSSSDQSPSTSQNSAVVADSNPAGTQENVPAAQQKIAKATSAGKSPQASDLLSNDGEKELFRLSAVQPAPYDFSGMAPHAGFSTTPSPSAARSSHVSSATEQRALYADGMRAYVDRNYDEASDLLQRLLQSEPNAPDANFYVGVILLLKGSPDLAVDPLKLAAAGRTRWAQPAHFYLAKAYLQTRNLASAESELKAAAGLTGNLTGSARADLASIQGLRSRENR
jgi:cytoskeletal protein RodZ